MEKNYSKSEILKFIYGELDPAEEKDFIEALYTNEELFREFEALQSAQAELKNFEPEFQPSNASMAAVMAHVKTSPPRKKRSLMGLMSGGPVPGFRFFATIGMVIICCVTIGFFMVAYEKASAPASADPETALQWEAPDLRQRIDFVRTNLSNMSGQRELLIPLHNNTYRVVNTADFSPTPANVVLLNVK